MGDIVEMNMNESNQSEVVKEVKEINYDTLKVVEREIPYSKVVDFIEFVRFNSYGKQDGKYHEYLMDYSEAVAILTMYTNCDSFDFKFDDVMKFIQSERWAKIKEELGDVYINFHYYVKKEIEYTNTPLRFADDAMKKATESIEKINEILRAIDVNALKDYDLSKIVNAIDAVDTAQAVKE
jgi:hypothetical protein